MSNSGIARYSTRKDMRFHKNDRAKNKILVNKWEYGRLPSKESMRKAIWRGNNCWGDNTSFGDYNSREHKHKSLKKMLDNYIGTSFDEYYSKMCKRFKGYDRVRFDRFLFWAFKNRYMFGGNYTEYEINEGLIIKN